MSTKGQIKTAKGIISFELYDDTPITTANFIKLSQSGYYNGLRFHRVIPSFVIQGGCPNGSGTGGPGYTIPCETSCKNQFHDKGVFSMAHRGPNTGGSQFFICLSRAQTQHLDGVHTCFGKITHGMEVAEQITAGDIMEEVVIF